MRVHAVARMTVISNSHVVAGIFALVCMFAFCLAAAPLAWADSPGVICCDGVYYTLNDDGTASVGRQKASGQKLAVENSFAGCVEIPSTVVDGSGASYTVVEVLPYAFSDGTGATASALTSLSLPKSVTSIGNRAFTACRGLTTVDLPADSQLKSVGGFAFAQCSSLQSMVFSSQLASVGENCFYACSSLSSIVFSESEPGADAPALRFDQSALATNSATSALTSIVLPERTASIAVKMFAGQAKLESVEIRSKELTSIGSLAFDGCASLKSIRIPKLTTEGSTPIGSRAFRGCSSLNTVTFLDDVTYALDAVQFSSEQMKETYVPIPLQIENVVYHGSVTSVLFPEDSNHYYRVNFYASKQEAEEGGEPLSYACLRDDTSLQSISSALRERDAKGTVLIEGSIPELSQEGSWFFPEHSKTENLTQSLSAYMVDDHNLACAELTGSLSYTYIAGCVKPKIGVCTAGGVDLQEGVDYDLTATTEAGASIALNEIKAVGSYALRVVPHVGSTYAGELKGTLTVTYDPVQVERLTSSSIYDTCFAVAQEAAGGKKVSTVILISGSEKAYSLAAAGLAGAYDGVIVQTGAKTLSTSAKTALRSIGPKSVIILGSKSMISSKVASQVAAALPSATKVSRLYASDRYKASAAFYARTKSKGIWRGSKTCIVTSGTNVGNALAIGAYAYATNSPIFLVNPKKGVSAEVKSAIKSGRFKNILLIGSKKNVPTSVAKALKKYGTCKRISGNTCYQVNAAITKRGVSEKALGYNNMAICSPSYASGGVCAAALCGGNGAALILANKTTGESLSNLKLAVSARYKMFNTYVVGPTSLVSDAVVKKFQGLVKK